ncbi:uncharacterized protein TRUGW13939_00833 [Talaromyces rugulosus]|uniref:3-hydroxyacyl-CoA dehydrogenase n=1 Tax=Talaromyces rugulosus TaxID=121627 RepID=A0A7H8QKI8_TALRU|nr:uncharacterized protein TRUGW13939_00833 [Talaromyces rugulosus]QKX53753.1 hypothetical protein TRUGW13939_00833 [Talaromyces rugulosus]
MPEFKPDFKSFSNLKDKVVVLTGGANGIGEKIVTSLYKIGAHVVFFDIEGPTCEAVVHRLKSEISSSGSLDYVVGDITKYNDVLALFQRAFEKHGQVDHALCIAGITEARDKNWFDEKLDLHGVTEAPSTAIVDVNLTGTLYFTRIASVYLRQGNEDRTKDKSICLLGSVASFKEQAGLFVYQPAKHGVLGLVRSTRKFFHHHHGIRINVVCPSMTNTRMATPVMRLWEEYGVAGNEPQEIADYVLTLSGTRSSPYVGNIFGLCVFVEAGKGWEIEKDLDKCSAEWIGAEMAENALKIEAALGNGSAWSNPQV